ncbi:hypothetical protein B0H14DRAFT_3171478 [Mycena olivaceomarginata]|nr:hypothetical protein B0H14DRAFT_3171478 [Mycena olivaceomarginata]
MTSSLFAVHIRCAMHFQRIATVSGILAFRINWTQAGNSGIGETGKVTGATTSGISSEFELAFDSWRHARAACPPWANIISPLSTNEPVCREHSSAKHFNIPLGLDFALARTARRRIDTAPPGALAVRLRSSWRARGRTRGQRSQGTFAIHASIPLPLQSASGAFTVYFNSIRTITVGGITGVEIGQELTENQSLAHVIQIRWVWFESVAYPLSNAPKIM